MTRSWHDRAVEEANLFNPAFCATLLAVAAKDFRGKAHRPLPFALGFLVLPIVLHPDTRAVLPHSTITSLLSWVQGNQACLVGFGQRVSQLKTMTREAILFGLAHDAIDLGDDGEIAPARGFLAPTERRTEFFTADARDCVDRAAFIGRWFSAAGTTSTIFSAWGVAP